MRLVHHALDERQLITGSLSGFICILHTIKTMSWFQAEAFFPLWLPSPFVQDVSGVQGINFIPSLGCEAVGVHAFTRSAMEMNRKLVNNVSIVR